MHLIHVSFDQISEFVPRIPNNRCPGEDAAIPRICVAPTIVDALNAIPCAGYVLNYMRELDLPIILHAYYLESSHVLSNDKVQKFVPDAVATRELWVLDKPEKVRRIDYELTGFIADPFTDQFGNAAFHISGVSLKKCPFSSNTENLLDRYSIVSNRNKLRNMFRENTYRASMANIGKELVEVYHNQTIREVNK